MRSSATPQRPSSASSGGSTVRLGMGRVRSGKTTATRSARRTSSWSGGPASGHRSAAVMAADSSPRPGRSSGSTTSAPSGTSTDAPCRP